MAAVAVSTAFSVRDAGGVAAARKLQHERRTVFILGQRVPEELEWDAKCRRAIANRRAAIRAHGAS
jgi:hypothetical protein